MPAPAESYGAPQHPHGDDHGHGFGSPKPDDIIEIAPEQTYEAPAAQQSYKEAPQQQQSYTAPEPVYEAPSDSYATPQVAAPTNSYSAPVASGAVSLPINALPHQQAPASYHKESKRRTKFQRSIPYPFAFRVNPTKILIPGPHADASSYSRIPHQNFRFRNLGGLSSLLGTLGAGGGSTGTGPLTGLLPDLCPEGPGGIDNFLSALPIISSLVQAKGALIRFVAQSGILNALPLLGGVGLFDDNRYRPRPSPDESCLTFIRTPAGTRPAIRQPVRNLRNPNSVRFRNYRNRHPLNYRDSRYRNPSSNRFRNPVGLRNNRFPNPFDIFSKFKPFSNNRPQYSYHPIDVVADTSLIPNNPSTTYGAPPSVPNNPSTTYGAPPSVPNNPSTTYGALPSIPNNPNTNYVVPSSDSSKENDDEILVIGGLNDNKNSSYSTYTGQFYVHNTDNLKTLLYVPERDYKNKREKSYFPIGPSVDIFSNLTNVYVLPIDDDDDSLIFSKNPFGTRGNDSSSISYGLFLEMSNSTNSSNAYVVEVANNRGASYQLPIEEHSDSSDINYHNDLLDIRIRDPKMNDYIISNPYTLSNNQENLLNFNDENNALRLVSHNFMKDKDIINQNELKTSLTITPNNPNIEIQSPNSHHSNFMNTVSNPSSNINDLSLTYGLPSSLPNDPSLEYGLPPSVPNNPSLKYDFPSSVPNDPSLTYSLPPSVPNDPSLEYSLPSPVINKENKKQLSNNPNTFSETNNPSFISSFHDTKLQPPAIEYGLPSPLINTQNIPNINSIPIHDHSSQFNSHDSLFDLGNVNCNSGDCHNGHFDHSNNKENVFLKSPNEGKDHLLLSGSTISTFSVENKDKHKNGKALENVPQQDKSGWRISHFPNVLSNNGKVLLDSSRKANRDTESGSLFPLNISTNHNSEFQPSTSRSYRTVTVYPDPK